VLGGSVSSRLFQEVQEKQNLAYSIYSFLSSYSDNDMITMYTATKPKEVDRVVDLVCREIRQIGVTGVERNELERIKAQMKGSLMLSLESSHSRMNKLAKDELTYGRHTSLKNMLTHIDRVNMEQVFNVSRQYFGLDSLAITGLGPLASRSLQAYK
ncbi:MAG: insulinase family protein, partial [Nitrospiraceae bacterium]